MGLFRDERRRLGQIAPDRVFALITLSSDRIKLELDPAHGAEVVGLTDLKMGNQILGRPPFIALTPKAGDLDEAAWTECYRGGWQMLIPNAGNSCTVGQTLHGFHGRGSNDPWTVQHSGPESALFSWAGHGIQVYRRLQVVGDRVEVTVRIAADAEPAYYIAAEHVTFGLAVLDPEVTIEMPQTQLVEISENCPTGNAPTMWPLARLLDGSVEPIDRLSCQMNRSRLLCTRNLSDGWAVVRNPATQLGIALSWDLDAFPYCWIWHEQKTAGGIWNHRGQMLGIEPVMVPQHLGLAYAIANGQARCVAPAKPHEYGFCLRLFHADRAVGRVRRRGEIEFL